ncbi:MAG: phage protease [Victivallaceae bacterium]
MKDLAIALSAFGEPDYNSAVPIERDASGVPVAWRAIPYGPWKVTKNGETFVLLDVTEAIIDTIIAYYAKKGVKVPIDSRHFLYKLAEKYSVDEYDIVRLMPDTAGTFGFCDLEKRADGLWVTNVEYVPLGRELIAEGIFRYFSPVIRGLSTLQFRVTSIAMENEPATDNLYSFAAAAEDRPLNIAVLSAKIDAIAASAEANKLTAGNASKETPKMKKLLAAIAGLLGMDSIALGADNDADDTVIGKLNSLKPRVAFFGQVRDALALGAEAQPETVLAGLKGLIEKGKAGDAALARIDALELSAETEKRDKLITQGKADGKLSEGLIPWAQTQDSAALSAYLEKAPVTVPLNSIDRSGLKASGDSVALTAEDRQVCKQTGISEEEFLAAKKK